MQCISRIPNEEEYAIHIVEQDLDPCYPNRRCWCYFRALRGEYKIEKQATLATGPSTRPQLDAAILGEFKSYAHVTGRAIGELNNTKRGGLQFKDTQWAWSKAQMNVGVPAHPPPIPYPRSSKGKQSGSKGHPHSTEEAPLPM